LCYQYFAYLYLFAASCVRIKTINRTINFGDKQGVLAFRMGALYLVRPSMAVGLVDIPIKDDTVAEN